MGQAKLKQDKEDVQSQLAGVLRSVKEGELVVYGRLLSFCNEEVAWKALENVRIDEPKPEDSHHKITFHLYFLDVFAGVRIVKVFDDNQIKWGA